MENELLGIGRLASVSGLPVSALRFYDGAGVLSPARVDPSSGYRFYRRDQVSQARLVAHLRRVGLPLDGIRTVLADRAQAAAILAAHLNRLEAGLADARREISLVHQLIESTGNTANTETTMYHCTLPAADLVRALREVRFAVCDDADEPRLDGVFLDSEPDQLRVIATDRYRLATRTVATAQPTDLHLLLPTTAVDELLASDTTATLDVTVADGTITISGGGVSVGAQVPDVDFPSYRSMLDVGGRQVPVDASALRAALGDGATESFTRDTDGVTYDVSRLSITASGVRVGASDDPDATVIGVNREYLLQALAAGDQLVLGLDDPITPLAIRVPDRDGSLSLLMPVRLDQPA